MKISKVNHVRAAVVKKGPKIVGALYSDPGKTLDIVERFMELNKVAMRLYNVFNPITSSNKLSEEEKNLAKTITAINKAFKDFIKAREWNGASLDSKVQVGLKGVNVDDNTVVILVSNYLRKGLTKQTDNIKKLIVNAVNGKSTDINICNEVCKELQSDYFRDKTKKTIVRSISNQNMVVQPVEKNGNVVISISENKPHVTQTKKKSVDTKKNETLGLNAFLDAFATLNEKDRQDCLRRLRRLVTLYFATPLDYQDKDVNGDIPEVVNKTDFNVWADHENGKNTTACFVKDIDSESLQIEYAKKDKNDKKIGNKALWNAIHNRNMFCYRYAMKMVEANADSNLFFDDKNINQYWIHHIENAVERILLGIKGNESYKLSVGYLQEKIWKDVLNHISIKYIAIGKAVFNYGLNDLDAENVDTCKLLDKASDGISSFDYEQIKANETLQRDLAVNVSFAAANLARATVDVPAAIEAYKKDNKTGADDFLLWKKDVINSYKKDSSEGETIKAIMQFFGGISQWQNEIEVIKEKYANSDYDYETEFLNDIKEMVYSMRNASYHFVSFNTNEDSWNKSVIMALFDADAKRGVSQERDKFYSNNLPKYYVQEDMERVLSRLYKRYSSRNAQIPSFNNVISRSKLSDFLSDDLKWKQPAFSITGKDGKPNHKMMEDEQLIWRNAIYFIFKEIYYNDFLISDDLKKLIDNAVERLPKKADENIKKSNKKEYTKQCAESAFRSRYEALKSNDVAFICQAFMTEYNQQNQSRKVKSSEDQKNNPDKFQGYKMLLYKVLKDAFCDYLKTNKEVYDFLSKPITSNPCLCDKAEFLPDWTSDIYKNVEKRVREKAELQKWYVLGRLLDGKSLNHLLGSIRSYRQYVKDIQRRAKQNGCVLIINNDDNWGRYETVERVLDLCLKLSSAYSHEITDYFKDEEEYASYLENYLNYERKDKNGSALQYLAAFCGVGTDSVGIYHDGTNPILNRNVIMSKMFGPNQILANVIGKVTLKDIEDYKNKGKNISGYKKSGKYSHENELEAVLEYQKIKNRVEFRDVFEYGEIINELMGQLVNWSYLRERDLLYFQLGFHYTCLNNSSYKPDEYMFIAKDSISINGAILYQIASMYINGLPMYSFNKNGTIKQGDAAIGTSGKVNQFAAYSEGILRDTELWEINNQNKGSIFDAGLEVFMNLKEEKNITSLRNTIDHLKYYYSNVGSILDLYSEVFDRFFTYDIKYKNNVPNMLLNILKRHFVVAKLMFGTGKKKIDNVEKAAAAIQLLPKKNKNNNTIDVYGNVTSDQFTYKVGDKEIKKDSKDADFCRNVAKLLVYNGQ